MKSKIQTSKNNNMETKSNSKNILIDTISNILVDSLDSSGLESVREALFQNIGKLNSVIKKNNTKETAPTKKIKDPNAPKRGKSSYIFFCVDKRQTVIDANPGMAAKEIIQELGNMWRNLGEKEKQRYVDQSVKDKKRYEKEMESYVPPENLKVSVKKKEGPKRGRTGYIFFCTEHRPLIKQEDSDLNTKEITSRLGAKWKSLSEEEKSPYVKLAEEDKKRYEEEKLNWGNNSESSTQKYDDIDAPVKDKKDKKSKKDKKDKKKKKSKKKSGYVLFCQEERDNVKETNPDYSSQQVTQELGELWTALSQEEQDEYNDRV